MTKRVKIIAMLWLWLALVPAGLFAGNAEAASEGLDLATIQSYAQDNSPVLKIGQADVSRAAGEAVVNRAALLPTLALSGGYDHYKLRHGIIYGAFGPDQVADDSRFHGRIMFNYVAFAFGRDYFSYQGARRLIESRRRDLARSREILSYQVSRGYYAVMTTGETIRATRATIDALRTLEKDIAGKVRVGRLPEVDLLKVRAEVAAAEGDLAGLKLLEEDAVRELCRLMGWESAEKPVFAALPVGDEVPAEDYDADRLLNDALNRRCDFKSLKISRESVEYRLKSVKLSYLPEIVLQAEASEQSPDTDDFVSDNRVGVLLQMPLFDGQVRKGEKAKLRAEADRLKALEADKRLEISRDVHTAVKGWREARSRFLAARRAVALGREVLKIEKLKYDYGRTTINFVLEAESGLLQARSRFIKAYYDTELARDNIKLATGSLVADLVDNGDQPAAGGK